MEDALLWTLIFVMMVRLMVYTSIVILSSFAKAMDSSGRTKIPKE